MTAKKLIFEKVREKIGNLSIKIGNLSISVVVAVVLGCVFCRRAVAKDKLSYLHQPAVATQRIESYSSNPVKNDYFRNNLETHYNCENNSISNSDLVYSLNQL